MKRATVPCNGCTECCKYDLLILHPELGDDPATFECEPAVNPLTGQIVMALKHRPEGGCIYLGEHGCTIHERAPAICREFDCRRFYLGLIERTTRAERRHHVKRNIYHASVLQAGRARLKSLMEEAE